jgi:hypothetical protein
VGRALPSRSLGNPIHLWQYFSFTAFQYLKSVQIYTIIGSTYSNSDPHALSPLQHLPPVPTPPTRRNAAGPPMGAPPLPWPAGAPPHLLVGRRARSAAAPHAGPACHHLYRLPVPERKVDKGVLKFNIFEMLVQYFFSKILNGSSAGS